VEGGKRGNPGYLRTSLKAGREAGLKRNIKSCFYKRKRQKKKKKKGRKKKAIVRGFIFSIKGGDRAQTGEE